MPMRSPRCLLTPLMLIVGVMSALQSAQAEMDPEVLTPVPVVQDARLEVRARQGVGVVPLHVTQDWTVSQPGIRRAVIVIHGWPRRDLRSGEYAVARAGMAADDALVITPQFLIQADIAAHHLPDTTLRWGPNDWAIGRDAAAPASISSFDVLDAILDRLADRQTFPNLRKVVVAGHSAGGRFVQRYAAVGHGQAPLRTAGVHIRYVVANPSDYLYFDAARPFAPAPGCSAVNRWAYGLDTGLPRYATQLSDPESLWTEYLAKDIVYLLGTDDNDQNHPQLDRSCAAEAQGLSRLQRGIAFVKTMAAAGALRQSLLEVPGVGHHSSQIFGSQCGVFALFDNGSCAAIPIVVEHSGPIHP
ncbi:alpha/beta hydrolase [Methylobacterium sp. CM6246]